MPTRQEVIEVAGREVTITNPDKVFFPQAGYTKLDLVHYYLAVADGALRGAGGRPMAMKRFVNGADGEFFFQKRAPESRPEWLETAELSFPSGRTANEVVLRDAAGLADAAMLVVEAGRTTRQQIQRDQRALQLRGVKLAGCILMQRR